MPKYQNLNSLDDVEFKRILFGYFPTYRNSPLKAQFDRVLQIGDASGMQSAQLWRLGACCSHLRRVTISLALTEALEADIVDKKALGTINAYQPALSAAWLFQRCMSVQVGSSSSPFSSSKTFINDLMRINFGVMQNLGDDVLKPFLQDVIRFKPLTRTLLSMTKNNIAFVPSILLQAGVEPIADWFRHFVAFRCVRLPRTDGRRARDDVGEEYKRAFPRSKFFLRRYLEAIEYGAGNDSVDKEIQRSRFALETKQSKREKEKIFVTTTFEEKAASKNFDLFETFSLREEGISPLSSPQIPFSLSLSLCLFRGLARNTDKRGRQNVRRKDDDDGRGRGDRSGAFCRCFVYICVLCFSPF